MEAADGDEAVDALIGDGKREHAIADGARGTAEQVRAMIDHSRGSTGDVHTDVAGTASQELLAECPVAETHLHHSTIPPLFRSDISQQIWIQVQIGAIESRQRFSRRVHDSNRSGEDATAEFIPECRVVGAGLLHTRRYRDLVHELEPGTKDAVAMRR